MSGRTIVPIAAYSVDDNVIESDDLFNIALGATLVLLGGDALTDDAVEGLGRVSVRGPTTIDDGLALTGSTLFVDMISVSQDGGDLLLGQSASDAVTARNMADAVWALADGASIKGAGSSQFVNLGLLEQTGDAGPSTIDANFYDRGGTIQVDGTLEFASPGLVNRFIHDTFSGPGLLELGQGTGVDAQAVLVGSTLSTASVFLVNARIVDNVTVSSATVSIGYVNLSAGSDLILTNSDAQIEGASPELIGKGTVSLMGDDTVETSGIFSLVGDVTFDNFGYLKFASNLTGESNLVSSEIDAISWSGDQITIENGVGATWNEQGDFGVIVGEGSGAATFHNDGTFIAGTTNSTFFAISVVNNGLVTGGSSLAFDDALTGTGTVEIGDADVATNAPVVSTQTFEFSAAPSGAFDPTLRLLDVAEFSGLVTGYDQGGATNDQIVVKTTQWAFQDFVANSGGTGGSLMFSNGAAETAVNLSGAYDPTGFHATTSGFLTTITYTG